MINKTQEQILSTWKTPETIHPLVSVRCITYNQEPYISQALDGFLMQITDFPFEVIVHDDASTDKTADIIRKYEEKYPQIIKPIYETENQYSKHDGSLGRIMNEACKGKYIAFCEGDDYWIDSNKLQMQIDFLEKNTDYVMCHTKAKIFLQEKRRFSYKFSGKNNKSYEDIFLNGSKIATLTTCFRSKEYFKYIDEIQPFTKNWKMGDLPIWLYFIKNYKIKFIKKVTGVYRLLQESASHSKNTEKMKAFNQSSYDIRKFFSIKYNTPKLLEQYSYLKDLKDGYLENDKKKIFSVIKHIPLRAFTLKRIYYLLISLFRK